MKSLLTACALIACSVTTAFACWQTERPAAVLHSDSLNLRVTDNNKPQKGAKFELHMAITFDREEARRMGAYQRKSLKSAATDSLGLLSFGEVKPGLYWIVPEGGTLSSSIAVQVDSPGVATSKRLWLHYYDDGCLDVNVEGTI